MENSDLQPRVTLDGSGIWQEKTGK